MQIIDSLKFVYVHIPKCGGCTVIFSNPQYKTTRIDNGHGSSSFHLPLTHLREQAPEVFEKILSYHSFANVREPIVRFRSALYQHGREYLKASSAELTERKLLQIARDVRQTVSKRQLPFPVRYEHFTPQSAYLELGSRPIIKHVSPIGDYQAVNRFFLENGLNKVGQPQNVSLKLKGEFLRVAACAAKPLARKFLSAANRQRILDYLIELGVYQAATHQSVDFLKEDRATMAFIEDFYGRDFEIYNRASH